MEIVKSRDLYDLFDHNIHGPVPDSVIVCLVEWGLISKEGDYKCPNGHILKLRPYSECVDGWLWRCGDKISVRKQKSKPCGYKVSLRKGTFFEKAHLTMYQILMFVLWWTKNVELTIIMEEAEISALQTGADWNSFCREVVIHSPLQSTVRIGGPGVIVEIDESKIGKRKYHRGHYVEGQWVFGAVERESGRCFMMPVEDRTRETLVAIIKSHILPGSVIVSDCWKSYDGLAGEGFTHYKVNHSENFKDPVSLQHTNTIEGLWRHLKASLPQFNRRKIYFNGYIQKFIFLRRCKTSGSNKFREFCRLAGALYNPLNDCSPVIEAEEPMEMMFDEDAEELDNFDPIG